MSIKARLFGKPWQQKDPAVRAQAVAESEDPELVQKLGHIAEHDESARVRLAALHRINTEPFWLDARLRESDQAIVDAADGYLVKAVMQQPSQDLLEARREWFRGIDQSEFIRRAARHAPDGTLRTDALARIDSPGFLGDCVVEESNQELALSLIERIDQISTLERIHDVLRRRNKRRTQAVAERLHALQASGGQHDPEADTAARLVERAERLARGEHSGEPRAELEALEAAWQACRAPSEALERRFSGALAIARRAMEAPRRAPAAEQNEPEQPAEEASSDKPDEQLSAVVTRLEALPELQDVDPKQAAGLLGDFDRAWQAIDIPGPADQILRERALPILRALQKRREQVDTPAPRPEPKPAPVEESVDWQQELDAAAEVIEGGDTARAQAGLRELRRRMSRLKPRQKPRDAAGRLGRLEGRLREMRNWEHWSNNKHRDEIIERVEQLADSGQHPDAISAALKEARREWQRLEDLEVLPGDKRRYAAPTGQWRRFQTACKQAFEQAQPYFEKRHEVQSENEQQLETFLERGHAIAEAQDSDIKSLTQFVRGARLAIRRLDDLPPRSRGQAAARLRALMDALSGRLDQAFEAIEVRKRGLIREAQALEHEADLKTAIDKAKALQVRWRDAGSGRRRIEQQLWTEFRAPIDPLFEKLRGEQDQQREQREAEYAALGELVAQAENLAAADDAELEQTQGRFRAVQSEWEAAGHRPAGLTERFEKAQRKLDKRIHDHKKAARREAGEKLDRLAEHVQQVWLARRDGKAAPTEPPELPTDDEHAERLGSALEALGDDSLSTDELAQRVADNGARARQVLIELEFLAGLDSPAEDREARMSYQVERLAERMSERSETGDLSSERAELRRRWYASFPQPQDQHSEMAKRYAKCQNIFDSMSGTQ